MIELLTSKPSMVTAGAGIEPACSGDLKTGKEKDDKFYRRQPRDHFKADTSRLLDFVKPRHIRRLDHFSQLALLGACLTAEHFPDCFTGPRCGLIIAGAYGPAATTFAFLDSLIDHGDQLASPTIFANSVNNAAAAHIARHLNITGPTLSLNQGHNSLNAAFACAAAWLVQRRVDLVLCGLVEEINQALLYGFDHCPHAAGRLGEGAVFFPIWRPDRLIRKSPASLEPDAYRRLMISEEPRVLSERPRLVTCNHDFGVELCPQASPGLPFVNLADSLGQMPILNAFYLATAINWTYDYPGITETGLAYLQLESSPESEKELTGLHYSITTP